MYGGVTHLVKFNQTGPPGGADYGDWASSSTARVQDAFGTRGVIPVYGPEATALDVIGYNYATPEPASLGFIASASVGLLARRRRA